MSETVRVRMKLKPLPEMTEKLAAKLLYKEGYLDKPENFDTYIDYMLEEAYEDFAKIGDKWYQVLDFEDLPIYDTFCAVKPEGELISVDAMYYNGGCCWQELVEEKLEILNSNEA